MNTISIITNRKLNAMFEEEEQSGREYIECSGRQEAEGFLYTVYKDTRTGKEYAVREIRTVHMGFNSNEDGKVEEFIGIVEREGVCKASWGVTGRTAHLMLAMSLEALLPQYEFEIDYDRYLCLAKKRLSAE